MTRYKKKMLILAMALIVCAVSILPWTQVAYATPDAEPTKTTIADKLILRLGPDWAGVEFELVTDVGKYPGTIVVDNTGVLALELSDSSTFTFLLEFQSNAAQARAAGVECASSRVHRGPYICCYGSGAAERACTGK